MFSLKELLYYLFLHEIREKNKLVLRINTCLDLTKSDFHFKELTIKGKGITGMGPCQ